MEIFEPLINLLVVLTILSVAAERATNLLKLREPELSVKTDSKVDEREREYRISLRSLLVGVLLALLVKADYFELLSHLDDPWGTFGWVHVKEHVWVRAPATRGWGNMLYSATGCVLTGVALGFGSKFWHDVLGTMYDLRNITRNRAEAGPKPPPPTTPPPPGGI